jgi:hypothetical protein
MFCVAVFRNNSLGILSFDASTKTAAHLQRITS